MRTAWSVGLLIVVGCGSMPTGEPDAGLEADAGGNSVDSGTPDAGPVDSGTPDAGPTDSGTPDAGPTDSGTPDAGGPVVGIPVVTAVTSVVHGTHQIVWQLPASGCSTVGVSQKVGAGSYVEVKVVAGSATSTQYATSHASGTYCYNVSCTLGAEVSAASNEKCVSQ